MRKGLKVLLAVVVVALMTAAATLAANSRSDASSGDTLVFGSAAEPTSLDGAVVSDGESLRVIDQITEGLVSLAPGSTTHRPEAGAVVDRRRTRVACGRSACAPA